MQDPAAIPGPSGAKAASSGEAVPPRLPRGSETVINPERRQAAALPAASVVSAGPSSTIVRRLFPPETEDGAALVTDAQPGVELGHFSIIQRIRAGGMGAVFRALDTRLARIVALKVLPPAVSRDPAIVQRFLNEAQAAARLDHENIARVYFVGEDQGLHFIAFEFVTGINVRDLIAQQGRLPAADAVNFGLQIAMALVHMAAQGVVHRDIKPSNIIITPLGRAKLVDLGLARKEKQTDEGADLTMAGTTLGTFDYISPEQARDPRTADVRSDIYSLGCTLYHMLTGSPPYPEGTVLQKLLQHQGDEAPDPALVNRDVPESLSAVIRKMMAKDPRRRYQSAEQLVRDLLLVAGGMGLRSVSPEGLVWLSSRTEKTSFWERYAPWLATAAALLLIVGYLEFGGPTGTVAVPDSAADPVASDGRGDTNATERRSQQSPGRNASGRNGLVATSEHPPPRANEMAERPDEFFDEFDRLVPGNSDQSPETSVAADNSAAQGRVARPAAAAALESVDRPHEDAENAAAAAVRTGQPPSEEAADSTGLSAGRKPADAASVPGAAARDDDGIFLVGRDGLADREFPSLEAACAFVKKDGAVIELRFDGRRVESGLRINRKLEIRAAPGRNPVIELRPSMNVAEDQVRAISIPSGSLELIDVDLVLTVDGAASGEPWSLFSIERPDRLRLQGSTVTIVNARQRAAAIVELRPAPSSMMPDMPLSGTPPRPALEVEIEGCLIRGQADLFLVRHADSVRLAVRQAVVALQGTLYSSRGGTEMLHDAALQELRLEHVTAQLTSGLLKLDCGAIPRKLAPLQVWAADNIFSNAGSAPLVLMTGSSQPADFRTLLSWTGKNNVYDRFQTLWSIQPAEGAGRSDVWDFGTWKNAWSESFEANPRQVDASIWARRAAPERPFSELLPGAFALDRGRAGGNPAAAGATNSSDAGANLSAIPRPPAAAENPVDE